MMNGKAIGALVKGTACSLTALLAFACGNSQQGMMPASALAVMTVTPTSQELNSTYPTTIRGKQDIEIRPRVSGHIVKLCVDEGAVVRKGQPLFLIDAVPYQKQVQAAAATVEVAKAALASAQANLAQAEANLANAQNDLSYTTITSPSNGVVGTIPYRVGSLVSSATVEPLTIVSDIDEMFAYFSMNEKQLLTMTRDEKGSIADMIKAMPEVQLVLADGSMYPLKGKIETVSGVIDPSTGAVQLRALFKNPNRVLRSGATGTILVPSVLDSVIVIPQSATTEMQDKKFVYVVDDSSKVHNTEITVFELEDGKNYMVTGGLNAGDRVVLEGVASLRDGAQIQPITPEQSAAKVKAMTQPQSAQGAAAAKDKAAQK